MADPRDPLGRIAAHAAAPYPAPPPVEADLRHSWRLHYRDLARGLPLDQVRDELAGAEHELAEINRRGVVVAGAAPGQRPARRIRLEAKVEALREWIEDVETLAREVG